MSETATRTIARNPSRDQIIRWAESALRNAPDDCVTPQLMEDLIQDFADGLSALEDKTAAETDRTREFNRGYLIACCNMTNMFDEPTMSAEVLSQVNITQADVDRYDLSEYDAGALKTIRSAGRTDPVVEGNVADVEAGNSTQTT